MKMKHVNKIYLQAISFHNVESRHKGLGNKYKFYWLNMVKAMTLRPSLMELETICPDKFKVCIKSKLLLSRALGNICTCIMQCTCKLKTILFVIPWYGDIEHA